MPNAFSNSGATRAPGTYQVPLPADLKPGQYVLTIEAARETGGREMVQVPITVAVSAGYDWVLHGRGTRPVLAMLGFSVGLVVVMSAVLAVLFL